MKWHIIKEYNQLAKWINNLLELKIDDPDQAKRAYPIIPEDSDIQVDQLPDIHHDHLYAYMQALPEKHPLRMVNRAENSVVGEKVGSRFHKNLFLNSPQERKAWMLLHVYKQEKYKQSKTVKLKSDFEASLRNGTYNGVIGLNTMNARARIYLDRSNNPLQNNDLIDRLFEEYDLGSEKFYGAYYFVREYMKWLPSDVVSQDYRE